MPVSTEATFSMLSKLGIVDGSITEELRFDIGVNEVLALLKCSLLSNTPLTETLLKHNPVPELGKEDFLILGKEDFDEGRYIESSTEEQAQNVTEKITEDFDQGRYIESRMEEPTLNVNAKIHVKLMVSKSKKMVCYAEASKDFVDLLFSFLTIPLGHVLKEMCSGTSKRSINNLYNSISELDAKLYLKSNEHKTMLVNPKLTPDYSYENHPLGIEEDKYPTYYSDSIRFLTTDKRPYPKSVSVFSVMNPKSPFKEATREGQGGGYLSGSTMFTVTDNLIITPISPISCVSVLKKLEVPFSDLEERVVRVDRQEALRLLMASYLSESALTNAFLREPKPEN